MKGMVISMKQSMKAKISSTIAIIVLLTVAIISFLSNYFVNQKFADYITKQMELKAQIISSSLSQQYTSLTRKWDMNYIHTIGMFSLYEGYLLRVYDVEKNVLWDAQAHDMSLCVQIMDDISERMRIKYPQIEGEITSTDYPLIQAGKTIGFVSVSYYGPYFLSENDFRFLDSLNKILIMIGSISLVISILIGHMLAKRISSPIFKTVDATKEITEGNYGIIIEEETGINELNLLIHSINHLSGSLEHMELLRKQLTEDVAHELRTPITILQSHIEAMVEGVWQPTRERLQGCYDETIRIGKLVSDLESLAKVESDTLHLEKRRINLYSLIQNTIHSLESEIHNKNIKVTLTGPHLELEADEDRMRQVITNLLSNAIKYSKEDGEVCFTIFDTNESAGFHITDNGIGISEKELPFIFERFYRADKSRNRMTGGTGIGLAIVKSIINAHGGKVSVQSTIDVGSCFTIELPKGFI